jgi:hypothetical protein
MDLNFPYFRYLIYLDLSFNEITTLLAVSLEMSDNLEHLDLSNNLLTNGLHNYVILPSIKVLILDNNLFYGQFPAWAFNGANLKVFSARNNSITGSLPYSIPDSLVKFDLSNNGLTGAAPQNKASSCDLSGNYLCLQPDVEYANDCGLDYNICSDECDYLANSHLWPMNFDQISCCSQEGVTCDDSNIIKM